MSTTNRAASGEGFERHEDTVEGKSSHTEGGAHPDYISHPGRRLNVTTLASAAMAVAIGAEFLRQNPQVRQACRSVAQDPEVHQACREAADGVFRAVTASWRRHDGMTALIAAFPRL